MGSGYLCLTLTLEWMEKDKLLVPEEEMSNSEVYEVTNHSCSICLTRKTFLGEISLGEISFVAIDHWKLQRVIYSGYTGSYSS